MNLSLWLFLLHITKVLKLKKVLNKLLELYDNGTKVNKFV